MNVTQIISELYQDVKNETEKGKTASYIPELAKIDPNKLGIHIMTIDQNSFGVGDYQEKFSIQSIAKVISLSLAYKIVGESIWERVGVEPSGNAFNSLLQLESDNGIPRNPFINAGALVISDILVSHLEQPEDDLLDFVHRICNNTTIQYCEKIFQSEKSVGYRNVALCNYMKALGNIENEPSRVIDFYFKMCSLEMSCKEVSELFLFLANNGISPFDGRPILSKSQSKRINAIMQTCGFYDESGEFAFNVGLPGKSGVGGGIVAVHPGSYAITIWSPSLNEKGNSYKGFVFLEAFTTRTESSIF